MSSDTTVQGECEGRARRSARIPKLVIASSSPSSSSSSHHEFPPPSFQNIPSPDSRIRPTFLLVRVASPLKVFLQRFCCNLIRRPLVCSGLVPQGRFRKKKNPSQRSRSSGCDVETLPIREEVEVGVWGGWLLCCPADRLPSPNFLILFSRHTPPSRFHSVKPCVPPTHPFSLPPRFLTSNPSLRRGPASLHRLINFTAVAHLKKNITPSELAGGYK